jgi:hypothetical protein
MTCFCFAAIGGHLHGKVDVIFLMVCGSHACDIDKDTYIFVR